MSQLLEMSCQNVLFLFCICMYSCIHNTCIDVRLNVCIQLCKYSFIYFTFLIKIRKNKKKVNTIPAMHLATCSSLVYYHHCQPCWWLLPHPLLRQHSDSPLQINVHHLHNDLRVLSVWVNRTLSHVVSVQLQYDFQFHHRWQDIIPQYLCHLFQLK